MAVGAHTDSKGNPDPGYYIGADGKAHPISGKAAAKKRASYRPPAAPSGDYVGSPKKERAWYDQRVAEAKALGISTTGWLDLDASVIQGKINAKKRQIGVTHAATPAELAAGVANPKSPAPGAAPAANYSGSLANATAAATATDESAAPGTPGLEGVAPGFFEDYPYAAMQRVAGGMGVQPLGAFGRYLQSLVAPLMARYLSGQMGGSQASVEDTFRQGLAGSGGVGPTREQAAGAFQNPNFQQYAEDPNNYDQALQLLIYGSGMPRFLQQWAAQRQVPNLINQFLAGSGSQGGSFMDFLRGPGNSFGVL